MSQFLMVSVTTPKLENSSDFSSNVLFLCSFKSSHGVNIITNICTVPYSLQNTFKPIISKNGGTRNSLPMQIWP